jgi:hypothetical protein
MIRVFAPESLAIDKPASSAQLEAFQRVKHLVEPGDVILLTTPGIFYSSMRFVTKHPADHAVIVLNNQMVLHVSPGRIRVIPLPRVLEQSRSPLIIRPNIPKPQVQQLVQLLDSFVGKRYDLPRVYDAIFRLFLHRHVGITSRIHKFNINHIKRTKWICSDIILLSLMTVSQDIRNAVHSMKGKLDYSRIGVASLEDFIVIAKTLYPLT